MKKESDETKDLEAYRRRLNEAIAENELDLLNPEVIRLSCELDIIVLEEMNKIG